MNLLWDLDGTIFDTYPIAIDSFQTIYGELYNQSVNHEKLLPMLKRSSKEAFEHFKIPIDMQKKYREISKERMESESKPFEGVEMILAKAHINVMVTHRSKKSTKKSLERWGLLKYFKEIVSPDDDGFLRKPDKGAYEYLFHKYHIDWAIGDRALDLIPAKAVGMKTCAFQNEEIEADLHISSYDESLINKLRSTK